VAHTCSADFALITLVLRAVAFEVGLVWRLQRVFRLANDTGRSLLCKGQEVDRHGVAVGVNGVGAQEVRSSGAVDGRFPRPERWKGRWIHTGIGEQEDTDARAKEESITVTDSLRSRDFWYCWPFSW